MKAIAKNLSILGADRPRDVYSLGKLPASGTHHEHRALATKAGV